MSIWPNGVSGGFSPDVSLRRPGKRGKIKGWSVGAARRNLKFLWSVATDVLGGGGLAVTLTLGETPESADEWTELRERWLDRLRYMGLVRYHWVTEWTARGRPHLHAAIYGDFDSLGVILAWLDVADSKGFVVSFAGQDAKPIHDATGWLQYVAKHAARGVTHYQRDGAPDGWEKTGRLWGAGGDWPIEEAVEVELGTEQYLLFRGLVWEWMLDDMTSRGVDSEFIAKTRERWMNPEHGNAHGVSGWIPAEVAFSCYREAIELPDPDYLYRA